MGIAPAIPQALQPVFARIALHDNEQSRLLGVYVTGNVIELHLGLNDVIPIPPQGERTESFLLGDFPAGTYILRLYVNAPGPQLVHTTTFGVAAPTPVPVLDHWSVLFLALAVSGLGYAFMRAQPRGQ